MQELFDRVGEKFQAIDPNHEMRNLKSGSLCFSDPPGSCLNHVSSRVPLMGKPSSSTTNGTEPVRVFAGQGLCLYEEVDIAATHTRSGRSTEPATPIPLSDTLKRTASPCCLRPFRIAPFPSEKACFTAFVASSLTQRPMGTAIFFPIHSDADGRLCEGGLR